MMAGRQARPGERATEGAARHIPVLLDEVLAALKPGAGEVFVDGTFGAGGYTSAILEAADTRVIAIDQDPNALAAGAALVEITEAAFAENEARRVLLYKPSARRERMRVLIDGDEARRGCIEYHRRIAAGAECAVDEDLAVRWFQRGENFIQQHGNVAGRTFSGTFPSACPAARHHSRAPWSPPGSPPGRRPAPNSLMCSRTFCWASARRRSK